MIFKSEAAFENALINELKNKGWEQEILKNPTEADLLKNWAAILFQNNRDIDRLNDVPLSDTEMQQIIEQIRDLKTPLKLNGFINGKTLAITRDNPNDALHLGKEVSLKIYDRQEIAAGQSRYQMVQQPRFAKKSKILNDRRGDINSLYNEIVELFANAEVDNFEKLPADKSVCGQFAKRFKRLNDYLEAAKIQGFTWSKLSYSFGKGKKKTELILHFDENRYLVLVLRYKELFSDAEGGGGGFDEVPFELSDHLTEIDTGKIDADYMNSRFEKYLKTVQQGVASEVIQKTVDELHKSFATLTQVKINMKIDKLLQAFILRGGFDL